MVQMGLLKLMEMNPRIRIQSHHWTTGRKFLLKWKHKKNLEKIENFEPQENIILKELDVENISWTHLHTFELFFDDKQIELTVDMTNQYALEKRAVNWTLVDKVCGRVQLSPYRMSWEEVPDVQHRLVKNAMPRNRLVAILQNLHFCNNTTLGKFALLWIWFVITIEKMPSWRSVQILMNQWSHIVENFSKNSKTENAT